MKPVQVVQGLDVLRRRFARVLERSSTNVLESAQLEVENSFSTFEQECRRNRAEGSPWGYTISPLDPLEFVGTSVRDTQLKVDLFCKVRWSQPEAWPVEQNIVVRVWALDEKVMFRDGLDSEEIIGRLDSRRGRVMLRYHFDLANEFQPGPLFHLQSGGNPREEEVAWLHEAVSIPRIAHPPTDLMLACEMIVANFFPHEAATLLDDPHWLGVLRKSQSYLLKRYFQECNAVLNDDESLLKHLSGNRWT